MNSQFNPEFYAILAVGGLILIVLSGIKERLETIATQLNILLNQDRNQ